MSYCPSEATSGFIQLSGPIPPHALKQISQNRYPIQTSFAPRTTPPSRNGFHIDDTNHTCIYRNKTYTSVDIQLCQPLHTGYSLPGVTEQSSAEMIISFTGPDEISGLLLCIPIFNTGAVSNDQYLSQVIHQPNITNGATLDSMIQQKSFGYRTCFETVNRNGSVGTISLYVLVFPGGVHLSNSDYALLSSSGSFPRFGIPLHLRNTDATVQTYTMVNGIKQSTETSKDGFVYTVQLSTCGDEFLHKFEYFLIPPPPVKKGKANVPVVPGCTTPLYQPNQYKCVPFDQNKNLNEQNGVIYVTPGTDNKTLQQLITPPSSDSSTSIGGYSVTELETIIGASVVGVVVAIAVGVGVYQVVKS